jgi:C-terminal processing protease CtpA/Prc
VGANGDVIVTPLPGDIKVYWTGLLVRNPDESRFFGVGIVPDVIVNKSLQDIRDGIDTERKVALELLRESLKFER